MKLSPLLEDKDPKQELRRAALELQAHLLDLELIELDVELENKGDDVIALEYHDKNHLVRGKIELDTTKTGNVQFYRAWTVDNGIIYSSSTGFNTAMILFKLFQQDVPFKPFEQSVISAFGTTGVVVEHKIRLAKDEVYGVNVTPPFKIEGDRQATLMVHTQKIIQLLVVSITSASTVRMRVHDSNGDVSTFEGPSIISIFPKLREFIKVAQEGL